MKLSFAGFELHMKNWRIFANDASHRVRSVFARIIKRAARAWNGAEKNGAGYPVIN